MWHDGRTWKVEKVEGPGCVIELSHKLTEHTWCGCQGFELEGYLFLNDSTSADGAQEYAIVRIETSEQIESITFGWMDHRKAFDTILRILNGKYDDADYRRKVKPKLDHPEGYCSLCA